jgi:hypothetical protein
MHFFAYATMLTVLGVWGGPYLYDVHKLDGVERGNVLLAMGAAQCGLGRRTGAGLDRLCLFARQRLDPGTRLREVVGGDVVTSWRWLVVVAFVVLPTLAHAQSPQRVPAPDRHPATGLVFPPQIADAQKYNLTDYGRSMKRPGLGYFWNYRAGDLLVATLYVYNLGVPTIPPGAASWAVQRQFELATADIEVLARNGRYQQLKTAKGPGECTYNAIVFRCMTLSAIQSANQRHVYTALMLTGYRNYYLKVRLDWQEGSTASNATLERFLSAMARDIVR